MTAVCLTGSGLQTNVVFVGIGGVFLKSVEEHIGWTVVPENSHLSEGKALKIITAIEGDILSVLNSSGP